MALGEGRIAARYTKALFELVAVPDVERVDCALAEVARLFSENAQLSDAMINPSYRIDQRTAAAKDIVAKSAPGSPLLENFIQLVVAQRRVALLPEIARAFSAMVAELKKLLAVEVTSAFPLGADEQSAIKDRIAKDYGSLASISWSVDPELIGGLLVKSGDAQLDGSVRGALQRARSVLAA